MDYGLIGGRLGHSYSKPIHEAICAYTYELCALPTEAEAHAFMEKRPFKAINVTIPYKQLVIPYCDEISPQAKSIHAVNTLVNRDGRLYGYNTDYAGFSYLLDAHGIDLAGKTVLILGTGGTRNTTNAVCRDRGAAAIYTVSRHSGEGLLTYPEAKTHTEANIILNASPAGMYPQNGGCLLAPGDFPALEAVVDCVYNPLLPELLLQAQDLGILAVDGLEMLVAQAVYAAEIFLDKPFEDSAAVIRKTYRDIKKEVANLTLLGSQARLAALGPALAEALGKRWLDLGQTPTEAALADSGKENRQVLGCGAGFAAHHALRQNGPVLDLAALPAGCDDLETIRRAFDEAIDSERA